MDLYRFYCQDVLNIPQSPSVAGAKDVWDSYLKDYFSRIENTPDGIPQNGDIVIWGTKVGKWGHIAIFIDGDAKKFNSFDQNYPVGTPCHIQSHTYNGVLGWLRPTPVPTKPDWIRGFLNEKGIDIANEGEARAKLGEVFEKAGQFDEATRKLRRTEDKLAEANGEIARLNTENGHLIGQVKDSAEADTQAKMAIADRDATIYRLQKKLADLEGQVTPQPLSQNWVVGFLSWLLQLVRRG